MATERKNNFFVTKLKLQVRFEYVVTTSYKWYTVKNLKFFKEKNS